MVTRYGAITHPSGLVRSCPPIHSFALNCCLRRTQKASRATSSEPRSPEVNGQSNVLYVPVHSRRVVRPASSLWRRGDHRRLLTIVGYDKPKGARDYVN